MTLLDGSCWSRTPQALLMEALMPLDFQELQSAQERDHAALVAIAERAEREILAVDADLKEEKRRQRISELRNSAVNDAQSKLVPIQQRAKQAEFEKRRYTPEATRRRAQFDADPALNATIKVAAFATLSRTPTPELLELLTDAVEDENLAMAEACRLEFSTRCDADQLKDRFLKKLSELKTPDAEQASQCLGRVAGLRHTAEQKMRELMQGKSDPIARLAAARAGGLTKTARHAEG